MVVDELAQTADRDRLVCVTSEVPLALPIDIDAFAIALRNLVENALIHSPANTTIAVRIGRDRIDVINEGPAIGADLLERLRQPFERGTATANGTSLGPWIADVLARQTVATLELALPAPGQTEGFQASLMFDAPSGDGA